jgi:transglutaminase-like putative cysteine protease
MRFVVDHRTEYRYAAPVTLGAHTLRLTPRAQANVEVESFALDIVPAPLQRTEQVDEHGNAVTELVFGGRTDSLVVHSRVVARTRGGDHVHPGRTMHVPAACAAASAVAQLAAQLAAQARGDPHDFAWRLTQQLKTHVTHRIREQGAPQAPAQTLQLGVGACRDIAVLFCAVCDAQGVPARFVSGYWQGCEPGLTAADRRWMHAWAEVYVQGAGWRGFDPSHGSVVEDGHLALAAAFDAAGAAPIEGSYYGEARSTLSTALTIDVQP